MTQVVKTGSLGEGCEGDGDARDARGDWGVRGNEVGDVNV